MTANQLATAEHGGAPPVGVMRLESIRHLAKARENTRLRNATNQVLHHEFDVLQNSEDLLECVPDAKASSSILTRKCSHMLS